MKKTMLMLFALFAPTLLLADAGILIPRDKAQPDPAILSLEEMEITVRIDNGDARVFVRQIFANHTAKIEEGNYIFALPSQATVSDFAVWDGPTRIPAVVLERKRAEDIYTQLKQQAIDPGLLQMGERGSEEAKRSSVFSARIVPIQPHGTKRLEIEYHQSIPVENLKSYFAIPLRPDAYSSQVARHLRVNFELHSEHAISNFQAREPPPPESNATRATVATRGLVLAYQDHAVAAMFTRSCGGRTRTPQEVRLPGDGYPYFSAVCAYCLRHPSRWVRRLSQADATNIDLREHGEASRPDIDRRLGWDTIPSNNFIVHSDSKGLVLEGTGEGHGIGLCQAGAKAMAQSGATFREILDHYYPNTTLVKPAIR
jgi:Vault protein inter-alpha-trypsin domain